MKNFIFSKGFFLMALSMGLLFFNSCTKDDISTPDTTDTFAKEFGKFTKEITISDESGENTAVLRVGSDDKSVLDMWQPENYRLDLIQEGQTFEEAMATINIAEEETSEEATTAGDLETEEIDNLVAGKTSTMIISKNLQPGVKGIAFTCISPYNADLRGWSYDTHYSEPGANEQTAKIKGQSFWHRGYFSLLYKSTSANNSWGQIHGEWTRIRNKEIVTEYRNPCYQFKAERKFKGNSVTVSFEY